MYDPVPLDQMPWYIAVPACIVFTVLYFVVRHYQNKKENH